MRACVRVCVATDIVCCNFVNLLFVFLLSAHLGKNSEDNWFDFLTLSLFLSFFLSFVSLYCYWYGYVVGFFTDFFVGVFISIFSILKLFTTVTLLDFSKI